MIHYVGVQLRVRLSALEKALHAVRREPDEEDALHDLRVAARRYSQAVRLFADFLEAKRVKQMRGRIRRLMEHCGAVRDCDVTLQVLDAAGLDDVGLREELAAERVGRQAKMSAHLQRWRGHRAAKQWRAFLDPRQPRGTTWNTRRTAARNAHSVLPGMFDALFAAGALAASGGSDLELHRFRLLGKRFRYSLELFEEVYGRASGKWLQRLGGLQTKLGDVHDCAIALGLVQGNGPAEEAIHRLLHARKRGFTQYWKSFQKQEEAWKRWLRGESGHGNLRSASRRSRAA